MRKQDSVDGILQERGRRTSLTFRKVRKEPCNCCYAAYVQSLLSAVCFASAHSCLLALLHLRRQCDSQLEGDKRPTPTEVEKRYVYEVYDAIAEHFSDTRYKPWPKARTLLLSAFFDADMFLR